ncbi:MAG: hypothetical protein FWJ62_03045 [Thermaerobacter sp.]|nr:hypothetical protein [Bacillota bacterium]REJ38231.1 MAG: hypothetical protein DIU84_01010 [Bacillota bacterium]
MEIIASEKGKLRGEVILYRMDDGRYRVYRHIPGVGSEDEVGSEFFDDEDQAAQAYEDLVQLLRRMNTGSR